MMAWNCTLDVLKKQMSLLRWNNLISIYCPSTREYQLQQEV